MSREVVLCIAGSPRRNGNSDRLLAEAMRGARDAELVVEHIVVQQLRFSGCLECGGCAREGRCVVLDEMHKVFTELDRADHVIIASPVFFMGVPGKLKCMLDRCQVYWARRFTRNEPVGRLHPGGNAAFIAVSGSDLKHGFDGSKSVVKSVCNVMEFKYKEELLLGNLDGPEDVLRDAEALKRAYEIGHEIARKQTT